MNKYILKDGKAVQENNLMKWARWIETANVVVERTEVSSGVTVSTVFLGLDHSFGSGDPILFETMIFGGERDGFLQRYSTRDEALKGHGAIVKEFHR